MATPEKQRPNTIEEAVAQLRRDPTHAVRARVDKMDVELRAMPAPIEKGTRKLGSRMAALGPWLGESTEEILRLLREARARGGSIAPPKI